MKHVTILPTHRPIVIELHDPDLHPHGCDCPRCEPPVPSVPARLDAVAIAKLAVAGFVIAHLVVSLLYGPATALRTLAAMLTWRAL